MGIEGVKDSDLYSWDCYATTILWWMVARFVLSGGCNVLYGLQVIVEFTVSTVCGLIRVIGFLIHDFDRSLLPYNLYALGLESLIVTAFGAWQIERKQWWRSRILLFGCYIPPLYVFFVYSTALEFDFGPYPGACFALATLSAVCWGTAACVFTRHGFCYVLPEDLGRKERKKWQTPKEEGEAENL